MSGSALNDSWGGCAADAPGRVGSGDTGTAQHTQYGTPSARASFGSAARYAADHALSASRVSAAGRETCDLLSASKSSSSAQDVILVSGLRNWSKGSVTPFFLDDMTVSQAAIAESA